MAYAGLLQDSLREAGLYVHLDVHNLGRGAGDPLARVQLAVQRLEQRRRTRIAPGERFILLDGDQAARDSARAECARQLADQHNIAIVWQEPCFEALLLRHLPSCSTRRPPDTPEAVRVLQREWPGYKKPLSRAALAERIDRDAVRRAAAVERALRALLRCLLLDERSLERANLRGFCLCLDPAWRRDEVDRSKCRAHTRGVLCHRRSAIEQKTGERESRPRPPSERTQSSLPASVVQSRRVAASLSSAHRSALNASEPI